MAPEVEDPCTDRPSPAAIRFGCWRATAQKFCRDALVCCVVRVPQSELTPDVTVQFRGLSFLCQTRNPESTHGPQYLIRAEPSEAAPVLQMLSWKRLSEPC